jgi:hypothetical protein
MAKDESKPKDTSIRDVMREESGRGRRRVDTAAIRRHKERLKDFKKLLETGTEEQFITAIRDGGVILDSPQFFALLEFWRVNRSS